MTVTTVACLSSTPLNGEPDVFQQASLFEGGEPPKELNQWNSLLELRFLCSVALVFSSSLWCQWKRCSFQKRACSPDACFADLASAKVCTCE